jgi:two-component system response regulator RegX3
MKDKLSILVVEDEAAIRTGLIDVLVYHGYDAEGVADGRDGLQRASSGKYDLIVLDVMLPTLSGFDICDAVRRRDRDQPIIMLTARVSDDDIVRGLSLGADDYVAKPFSIAQLLLRIETVLRRSRSVIERAAHIRLGDLDIDTRNLSGKRGAQTIPFTRREMDVLEFLHANASRCVSREELLTAVWGYAKHLDIETRTVDIHVAKLRRKIEIDPKEPVHLLTVRGAGYRLASDEA